MKIAIRGAGGVGCHYGAQLFLAGHDVHLIARGAHLEALQRDGLHLDSQHIGQHHLRIPATGNPADVGPVELILFCVKSQHTREAAEQMQPLVGPDTLIVSLQNGVDNEDILAEMYGPQRILAGMTLIVSTITDPGHVRQRQTHRWGFGEYNGGESERTRRLYAVFKAADMDVELSADTRKMLWEKFVWLTAMAGCTTLAMQRMYHFKELPEAWELVEGALRETWTVGRALGVPLEESLLERFAASARRMPYEYTTSMQRDRERGKTLEVASLSGAVVRLGKKAGVPTPIHAVINACLSLYNHVLSGER